MADLTTAAMRVAARQHGVITIEQLTKAGVSRHTVRRLEKSGVLLAERKSVRRLGSSARTLEQRCVELCAAHRNVFVTGVTAGKLIGLRKMPRNAPIILSGAHPLHFEHVGVRYRRSTKVNGSDMLRRPDGLVLARLPRLAFDLAASLQDLAHRSIVDQLIHEHSVSVEELVAIGSRLYHPTRPGSDRFVKTVMAVSDCPAESDAEFVVADALRSRGVPIEANRQWLELPNGRRARLDLAIPDLRWGIEVDVHPHHLGLIGSTNDKQRDRQAKLLGWSIDRVTGLDLADLDRTIDELVAIFTVRRRELAA
jgi:DNA-binding transcriptional MerR regulator